LREHELGQETKTNTIKFTAQNPICKAQKVGDQLQSMKTDKAITVAKSGEHKKLTFMMDAIEEMKRKVGNCWFVVEFGCLKVAMVMAMTLYLSFFIVL
jgi:hypothetical protein